MLALGQTAWADTQLNHNIEASKVSEVHAKAKIQTLKFDNGDKYVGTLKNGKMHGTGTYYFHDGAIYTGECANGDFSGKGKLTFSNGNYYIGQFAKDKFNGQGEYHYINGDVCKGNFVNDLMEGKGTIHYIDGSVYEGNFKKDMYDGQGTFTDSYGKYTGSYKAGEKHGKGKIFNNLGITFEGTFNEDVLEGNAIITFDKDLKIEGILEDGDLVGKTTVTYKGKKEIVDFSEENVLQIGEDLIIFDSLMVYRGGLKDGLFDGKGTFLSEDSKVEATFKEGDPVEGTMKYASGETYKGLFDEDFNLLKGTAKTAKGDTLQVTYTDDVTHYTGSIKIEGKLKKVEYGLNEDGEFEYFRLDNKAYEADITDERGVDEIELVDESGKVIKFLKAYLFF